MDTQQFLRKVHSILEQQIKANHVKSELQGSILNITIDRPERSNAFNAGMFEQFSQILNDAATNPKVSAVILRGKGKNFCTGNDLKSMMEIEAEGENLKLWAHETSLHVEKIAATVINFPKPLIACVQGQVIGFMFTLMALFDLVLVTEDATFQAPMVKSSQGIEMCGSLTFPRIFGPSRTFEILVLAKTVNAKLLVDHGFALKSYPTVQAMEDDVNQITKELTSMNSASIQSAKHLMRSQIKEQLSTTNVLESRLLEKIWGQADFKKNLMKYFVSLQQSRPKL